MTARSVKRTARLDQFDSDNIDNRKLKMAKHRRLEASMRKYGFLACFPIIVLKQPNGRLLVKDGQHRLRIAEALGLEVYYVECEVDFDIAEINSTSVNWAILDYAVKHKEDGKESYADAIGFMEEYAIPVASAFALLAGTTSFGNCRAEVIGGTYRVRDRKWAHSVGELYTATLAILPALRGTRFLGACMAVCRVRGFDARRFLRNAERCRDKLQGFGTRDSLLAAMEEVYNDHHQSKATIPLRHLAMQALKERSAAVQKERDDE